MKPMCLLGKLARKNLETLEDLLTMAINQVQGLTLIFGAYRSKLGQAQEEAAAAKSQVADLTQRLLDAQSDDDADEAAKVELTAQRDQALADAAAYKQQAEATMAAEQQEEAEVETKISQELEFLGITPEVTPDVPSGETETPADTGSVPEEETTSAPEEPTAGEAAPEGEALPEPDLAE